MFANDLLYAVTVIAEDAIVGVAAAELNGADLDEDCIAYLSIEDRNDLNNSKQATRFASIYCHAIEQHLF